MDTIPRLLPVSTLARLLGVTRQWLVDEANAGRLPCVRAGRQILMDRETVEATLLQRAGAPPQEGRP
jgi:excisionase family DNA binding protein